MQLSLQAYGLQFKNVFSCFKNQADKMNDMLDTFQKTHACPKCANSYFTLNVHWMDKYVKTVYTCESCNWSFIRMASCTSPSSVPVPSSPNQSVVSEPQTQTK